MNRHSKRSRGKNESGMALLVAIFVLLLISAVALSMVFASGTETALAGNYRSAAVAYSASMAGLEEGRGRLLTKNPGNVAGFFPTLGTPLAVTDVRYILNPASGETVDPTNQSSTTSYPDKEYKNEFGWALSSATVKTTTSVSPVAGLPGPSYKWVRITPATEKSLGIDINHDSKIDTTTPIYYDAAGTPPSLIVSATPPSTAYQVFQITALAVLPNRSEKLLQYVVTATTFDIKFPSALTFGANNMTFNAAQSNPYKVDGVDGSGNPPAVTGCNTNPLNVNSAIGATNAGDVTTITNSINSVNPSRPQNYIGTGGTSSVPSVSQVSLPSQLSSPASAYQLVQQITQAADLVITPPGGSAATNSDLPTFSSTNPVPQTIVVNGNLTLTGNYTGYGILVVTGNFSYSGDDGWKGIVLVVGDGTTTYTGSGGGNNEFDGAVYVATIWDNERKLLTTFGPDTYDISGGGGNGIYYNSCWIRNAQQPTTYQVLSFQEIPYND